MCYDLKKLLHIPNIYAVTIIVADKKNSTFVLFKFMPNQVKSREETILTWGPIFEQTCYRSTT